jgi:nucleotide-binding universal stress UspA family protein
MFKRILVPTDGSDITAKAVATAVQLAQVHGAQLLTLSVMEPFPYSAVSEIQPVPPQEFIDAQQRVASQRVEAVCAAAAAQGMATPGKPSSTTPRPRAST